MVADVRSALGFLLAAAIRDVGYFVDCGCTPPGDVETRVAAIRAHLSGHRLAASLIDLSSSLGPEPDLQAATIAGLEVKRWAEDSGKLTTARIFAQGLARLNPDDLSYALDAARLSRDTGEMPVAESWFRRIISRARTARDWYSYAWGFIGLGVLYHRVGNHPAAVVVFHRARRASVRRKISSALAAAHHHLFTLAAESGRFSEVYPHLEAAFQAYGAESDRLPALAHDAARFWIEMHRFDRALPVLEAVCPLLEPRINEYTLCRANLAWAAAGAGDMRKFETFEQATLGAIGRRPHDDIAAQAYLHLAYALEVLRDPRGALSLGRVALELSTRSGSMYVREKTEELLGRLGRSSEAPQPASSVGPEPPKVALRGQRFAEFLVSALGG